MPEYEIGAGDITIRFEVLELDYSTDNNLIGLSDGIIPGYEDVWVDLSHNILQYIINNG